jgi:hypothetical protein
LIGDINARSVYRLSMLSLPVESISVGTPSGGVECFAERGSDHSDLYIIESYESLRWNKGVRGNEGGVVVAEAAFVSAIADPPVNVVDVVPGDEVGTMAIFGRLLTSALRTAAATAWCSGYGLSVPKSKELLCRSRGGDIFNLETAAEFLERIRWTIKNKMVFTRPESR